MALSKLSRSVAGKVVIVTGAASGMGRATARLFADEGASVALIDVNEEPLQTVLGEIRDAGYNAEAWTLDLLDRTAIGPTVDAIAAHFGSIDILINNAGISQRSLTIDTDLDVYAKLMHINYLGTVAVTKSVLPEMIERGTGQVVTITSLVGKFGTPLRSGYAASKHALHGFFDSLRAEIHATGVNILLVCPGFIQTEISKNALVGNGDSQGTMDAAQENGMDPDLFVQRLIGAINSKKEEVCIGGKETYGVLIKRFFPRWFSKIGYKLTP